MGEELNRLLFIYNLGYLKPEHNFHWFRRSREMRPRDAAERRSREAQPRGAAERRSREAQPRPEISPFLREGGGARDMSGSCPGHVRELSV